MICAGGLRRHHPPRLDYALTGSTSHCAILPWPLSPPRDHTVTSADTAQTLPVGLATFVGGGTVGGQSIAYYGMNMAGAVLATIPALVIFLVLQRYFVEGIALTGLKG